MQVHQPSAFLALLLFAPTLAAQTTVGPWTLALVAGNSYPPNPPHPFVVSGATNAPGVQTTACVTIKAISSLIGPNTATVTGSACNRVVEATTTLTVGPAARSVLISYSMVGFLNDTAPGETCNAAMSVTLDGSSVLAWSPLPPSFTSPCPGMSCGVVAVNQTGGTTLCLTPGVHTLVARLGTYATDSSTGPPCVTISNFFDGPNGLTVCVVDQGPCAPGNPEFIGWSYNGEMGATSRGALGGAAGEVMTRIDGGEHAGWGTAVAGRRTVRSLYFQVQDQEIATPESFDIRLYPEDPFNPGFPDLAAGVTYAVGVSGPSGTSGIAAAAVVRPPDVPGVGDSVPIRGGGDVFVSFVLVASPSWPADGVSIQIVLGYQPSPTFTVWDTPGLAQGNTPPPPGSPQNSHGLSRTGAGAAVYNTRRNQLIDVAHDTAGGTTLAITNQPQLVGSHNPPPAGFGPAPGTADFLSGSNPDVVGGNPGRIDDIAMEFWKTGIGSGALVFFLMDFSATFGPELPVASFTSGTGVLCLHLASMQTVGVGLTMANEAWLVTAVPGSLRNGLAGMSVKQQAAALDPVTGAVHASPCRSQVF